MTFGIFKKLKGESNLLRYIKEHPDKVSKHFKPISGAKPKITDPIDLKILSKPLKLTNK